MFQRLKQLIRLRRASEPTPSDAGPATAPPPSQDIPHEADTHIPQTGTPASLTQAGRLMVMNTIVQMVHITLAHESPGRCKQPLAQCPGCAEVHGMLDRIRGNRDPATWQPSDRDVRLFYEAYRRWYLRAVTTK
jgi:hypothetical protein